MIRAWAGLAVALAGLGAWAGVLVRVASILHGG